MEKIIGFTLITVGTLIIIGVIVLSKQQIAWPILRASIYLAVPILALWFAFSRGSLLAENILLEWPAPLLFLGALSILVYLFSEMDILPYSIFLVGFMIAYFGMFFVFVIGNLNIGF